MDWIWGTGEVEGEAGRYGEEKLCTGNNVRENKKIVQGVEEIHLIELANRQFPE